MHLSPEVELHHGSLSQLPPYDRIEVYGARPNEAVQAALRDIEFTLVGPTSEGFTAVRAPSPEDHARQSSRQG